MSDRPVFPALLRYWRHARGLSQLDLAGAADVSARHISFLETGRARPSRAMVLRLGASLDIALREQNAMLVAAGFAEAFTEPDPQGFSPAVENALRVMMDHHEPYPLLVLDRGYDLVMANEATGRLLRTLLGDAADRERNVMKLLFDPELLRPFILDWPQVAGAMLSRLQREALLDRRDLGPLLSALCAYPEVPGDWRTPDFSAPSEATLELHFSYAGQRLGFLTTLTVFQAPQNISLQEMQIESYFPLDDATDRLCRMLAGEATAPAV
ncbi:MAG: helix-turn-helix transcriptional regulator [Myxococcota bacterium]